MQTSLRAYPRWMFVRRHIEVLVFFLFLDCWKCLVLWTSWSFGVKSSEPKENRLVGLRLYCGRRIGCNCHLWASCRVLGRKRSGFNKKILFLRDLVDLCLRQSVPSRLDWSLSGTKGPFLGMITARGQVFLLLWWWFYVNKVLRQTTSDKGSPSRRSCPIRIFC